MVSVNPVRGQEEPLGVDIGFYDTGYPSITLRDEQGDRCLTVDYRGYVPNLHIAVPRRSNTDIELLREKGVIRSCNPVKTDFQGGEPVGVFPLTRRCVLEVFSAVTDHYSRVPHVDIDLVSLEGCSVRGPFRVSYQEQLRNSAAVDTVSTEAPAKGYGEISILEYALEKAQERWGSSSDIGILIAQDGNNQERTNLAWCAQKNLYTLIIEELTTRYGFEIEGQYFFEDDWNALKRMIRQGKVPSIRKLAHAVLLGIMAVACTGVLVTWAFCGLKEAQGMWKKKQIGSAVVAAILPVISIVALGATAVIPLVCGVEMFALSAELIISAVMIVLLFDLIVEALPLLLRP